MIPRFIESWEALPRAAEAHLQERFWFDLKETYSPKSQAEMAKDLAAFANAVGGALIVGAKEGPTGPDYTSPLSADYAARIEAELDEAVRDLCRPSPMVHVRTIPVPERSGKAILVANVEPFVDQPVAARHKTEKDMWRFPQRVGRHTEYLLPEQLPLFMNSKARRAKLLLLRAMDSGGDIDLFTVPSGLFKRGDMQGSGRFIVDSVDREGGGAAVVRDAEDAFGGQSVAIPFDDVEAVWLQETGRWAVRLSGRLEAFTSMDGTAADKLTYVPPSTFVVSPVARVVEDLSSRVRDISRALAGTLVVQHHPRAEPSEDAVRAQAHHLWLRRVQHNLAGTAEEDWAEARRRCLRSRDG